MVNAGAIVISSLIKVDRNYKPLLMKIKIHLLSSLTLTFILYNVIYIKFCRLLLIFAFALSCHKVACCQHAAFCNEITRWRQIVPLILNVLRSLLTVFCHIFNKTVGSVGFFYKVNRVFSNV